MYSSFISLFARITYGPVQYHLLHLISSVFDFQPQTEKEHARIEKTAVFIAKHGIQMEIMIKTKQSKNAQFEFMNFENPLNLYYQHLVKVIKEGKYRPKQLQEPKKEEQGRDWTNQIFQI